MTKTDDDDKVIERVLSITVKLASGELSQLDGAQAILDVMHEQMEWVLYEMAARMKDEFLKRYPQNGKISDH